MKRREFITLDRRRGRSMRAHNRQDFRAEL
jgi:hypothetical protein